jgi:hypothetical protein
VHDNSADAVTHASFATSYNPTYGFTNVAGINVSPNMKAAVYGGLLSSEGVSVHTPPFSCPSGRCKWDPFYMLAVEVQSQDAPQLFNLTCDESNSSESCNVTAIDEPYRFTRFLRDNETAPADAVFYFTEATVLANEGSSSKLNQPW